MASLAPERGHRSLLLDAWTGEQRASGAHANRLTRPEMRSAGRMAVSNIAPSAILFAPVVVIEPGEHGKMAECTMASQLPLPVERARWTRPRIQEAERL